MENKFHWTLVISILLIMILSIRKRSREIDQIKLKGIYSIAYYKEPANKWFKSEFYYKGKTYLATGSKSNEKARLFVKFLPNNPDVNYLIYNIVVPNCITKDRVPEDGYKEIALDLCESN